MVLFAKGDPTGLLNTVAQWSTRYTRRAHWLKFDIDWLWCLPPSALHSLCSNAYTDRNGDDTEKGDCIDVLISFGESSPRFDPIPMRLWSWRSDELGQWYASTKQSPLWKPCLRVLSVSIPSFHRPPTLLLPSSRDLLTNTDRTPTNPIYLYDTSLTAILLLLRKVRCDTPLTCHDD